MMEFKEGSMKIAEKTGCPIIPVAMTGTAEIFEKHIPSIKKSHVTVTFGKPIDIKTLEKDQKEVPRCLYQRRDPFHAAGRIPVIVNTTPDYSRTPQKQGSAVFSDP